MTWQHKQGVIVLLAIVAAAVLAAVAYNAAMAYRYGPDGTISSGMSAMGKRSPLFAALTGALFVGGAVGLVVHWFEG